MGLTRTRLLLLAAVIAAVVSALAAGVLAFGRNSTPRPSLREPGGYFSSVSSPVRVNVPYSYGGLVAENVADEPVKLLRVELVGNGPVPTLVGAYALPVPNRSHIGFVSGYRGGAIAGRIVRPNERVDVVVGLKVTKAGVYRFTAIDLFYERGGDILRARYALGGRLCAPESAFGKGRRPCPPLDADDAGAKVDSERPT